MFAKLCPVVALAVVENRRWSENESQELRVVVLVVVGIVMVVVIDGTRVGCKTRACVFAVIVACWLPAL